MTGTAKRKRRSPKKFKKQNVGICKIAHESADLAALEILEVISEEDREREQAAKADADSQEAASQQTTQQESTSQDGGSKKIDEQKSELKKTGSRKTTKGKAQHK